jgi:hypothetical protein
MAQCKVVYTPRADATPESELSPLAAAYRFVMFDRHMDEKVAYPGGLNDVAVVRHKEEVGHVEQRPDRPSEIVVTPSRKGSEVES